MKQLNGSFTRPLPKKGNPLPEETVEKVQHFYENEENSRIITGVKNTKSVKVDGEKVHKQKKLIIFTLRDLYFKFCEENTEVKIGLSKFCSLRPEHCVFAADSSAHNVCVCIIHQNCELMLEALSLSQLTANSNDPITNLQGCLNYIVCRKPTASCYLNECELCPGTRKLMEVLLDLLQKKEVENFIFCMAVN